MTVEPIALAAAQRFILELGFFLLHQNDSSLAPRWIRIPDMALWAVATLPKNRLRFACGVAVRSSG